LFVTVTKERDKAAIAADIQNSCCHIGTGAVKGQLKVIDNKTIAMFRARVTMGDARVPDGAGGRMRCTRRRQIRRKRLAKGSPTLAIPAKRGHPGSSQAPTRQSLVGALAREIVFYGRGGLQTPVVGLGLPLKPL